MSDISPYEKDQLRKKYGRNNISGHELDIYRKSKAKKEARTKALAHKMVEVSGHRVREGSKRHSKLVAEAKHGKDLSDSENNMKKWHERHGDYPDAKPGSDYMGAN